MAKIRNPLAMTIPWTNLPRREVYLDFLVKKYHWSVGIEVGVRFGRTLFYLLDKNPSLKMYAVDKDISQFYNQNIQNKYKDRLIVLEGSSNEQAAKINELVDFTFIDAGHGTKDVVKDINAYSPLLKTKQGLIGHDIDFPAVQAALKICNIDFEVGPDNVWIQKNL